MSTTDIATLGARPGPVGTALVTGASGGVGAETVRRLSAAGWSVVCHSAHGEPPGPLPSRTVWTTADLMTEQGVSTVIGAARHACGESGLGLLVHCAGQLLPDDEDPWHDGAAMYALHALAPYRLATALQDLLAAASGTVVLISSSSAARATPGQALYGASKAAGEALVRHLGYRFGRSGVRVVGIRPSLLRTTMSAAVFEDAERVARFERQSPFGRIGEPGDVAGLVLALASPDAGWLTGRTVWADGGVTLGWCDEFTG